MKQLLTIGLSIYLSLVCVVPAAVWEEFVKLPQLWEHFQLHRQVDPALSLTDFINLHYGDESPRHQNQHDHSQIPFKAAHHCLGINWHIAFIFSQLTGPLFSNKATFILLQRPVFHYNSSPLSEHTFSFFHPPRIQVI